MLLSFSRQIQTDGYPVSGAAEIQNLTVSHFSEICQSSCQNLGPDSSLLLGLPNIKFDSNAGLCLLSVGSTIPPISLQL